MAAYETFAALKKAKKPLTMKELIPISPKARSQTYLDIEQLNWDGFIDYKYNVVNGRTVKKWFTIETMKRVKDFYN